MLVEVDATNQRWAETGRRINEAREAAYLSQGELGEAIGLSQTTVSDICLGKISGKKYLTKIAQVLGVTEEWLRTGRDPLSAEVAGQSAKVSDLQAKLIEQYGRTDQLASELAAAQADIARLRAENARLLAELIELRGTAADHRSPQAP